MKYLNRRQPVYPGCLPPLPPNWPIPPDSAGIPGPPGIQGPPGPQGPPGEGLPLSWAMAWENGTLANQSLHGGLNLTKMEASPAADYYLDSPFLTMVKPGTYLLRYQAFFPAGQAVDTTVFIQLNNVNLPTTVLPISRAAGSPSAVYSAQAIAKVGAFSTLRVCSLRIISLTDSNPAATALALTAVKIG